MTMKRYVMGVCALFLAVSCGGGPTTPAPGTPQPNTINFIAALSAANEVPPITNADSNARGEARIQMNLTRDSAGAITAATWNFVYDVTGFPAGTLIVATHIHEAAPGSNGTVRVDSGLTAATGVLLSSGAQSNLTYSNRAPGTDAAGIAQRIIDNPNGFYFNVHTSLNTGGAVRGPLVRQP
jgi:CHRD domain-containing protein